MQPDSTLIKMSRDIAAKLSGQTSHEQLQDSLSQEDAPAQPQAMAETSSSAITPQHHIQVVPLYTPDSSAINFFCVHPSHRYALNLVPISTGFQGQVNRRKCVILLLMFSPILYRSGTTADIKIVLISLHSYSLCSSSLTL